MAFQDARIYIPDGVSSPMRTFHLAGGKPIILRSAKGCKIVDIDGNEYTDFLCGFGAVFLGHARDEICAELIKQINKGTVYGLLTEMEYLLAKRIVQSTPAIEKIRFVCSGSEAVMTAVRIARAYTKRNLLVKFIGSYHGHTDALLAQPVNSSPMTKGSTSGIVENDVLLCEYNNITQLEDIFSKHHENIAAIIVEPISTNMGLVKPIDGFHKAIRALCNKYNSLFIFDEVVTGFRFRFGGVSKLFDVDPDLTTFGKIIGGGTPIGAYAGKEKFMELVEIGNIVFQSGTFAGNPLSMVAGNAALDIMEQPSFYKLMEEKGARMESEICANFNQYEIPYHFARYGSLCGIAFRESDEDMVNYADVKSQQYEVFKKVHMKMREAGFLMAPSLEEPIFISAAHSFEDIGAFASSISQSIAAVIYKQDTNSI
jgi:glutamate-1-semialdehyde 2,1-aminomutase